MSVRILTGDCRDVLATLPDRSVQCVVTSPPYFGLRDYGTASWEGGDSACKHEAINTERTQWANSVPGPAAKTGKNAKGRNETKERGGTCGKCGATRTDSQIGLEQTPDAYVAELVAVFREVRRVLRDDGTLWLNLGDSYNSGGTIGRNDAGTDIGGRGGNRLGTGNPGPAGQKAMIDGLKPKDLIGIPWLVAFALRADGWWLRQDIIWAKPNPMPESVTDRCTKAHEYLFLLTKSARYYFDAKAIAEGSCATDARPQTKRARELADAAGLTELHLAALRACGVSDAGKAQTTQDGYGKNDPAVQALADEAKAVLGGYTREFLISDTRNRRSVWTIATQPYSGAHFATMPPDLVEPCIKAGSSERGQCPHCGAPWARQLSKEPMVLARSDRIHALGRTRTSGTMVEPPRSETTGWAPSCACPLHQPVPQTILDPFGGAGTTALVADRLQRDAIIIELNPAYVEIARERINGDAGLFAPAAE